MVTLLLVGSSKPDRSRGVFCDGTSKYAKWTNRESGSDSQRGHRFLTVPSNSTSVAPTQPLIHWAMGAFSTGIETRD
jgi:hypothetical protein